MKVVSLFFSQSCTFRIKYFQHVLFFPPFGHISQRAIEAQVEEKRRQREQERAMKKKEEEEEERRLSLERQMLEKQYKLDIVKEKQVRKKYTTSNTYTYKSTDDI